MSDEQYHELIQRLDRIIEILHKDTKPVNRPLPIGTVNEDGVIRPMTIQDVKAAEQQGYSYQWQGTCRACYLGICDEEYPHT